MRHSSQQVSLCFYIWDCISLNKSDVTDLLHIRPVVHLPSSNPDISVDLYFSVDMTKNAKTPMAFYLFGDFNRK